MEEKEQPIDWNLEYAKFNVTGFDGKGKKTYTATTPCIADLQRYLDKHPTTTNLVYKISRNEQLVDGLAIKYVAAWSRLWFFGDFLKDPEKIVKEDEFTWDLTTVTGMQMYPIMCILRMMQENPKFVYDHKDLDLSLSQDELGKAIMKLVYPNPPNKRLYGNAGTLQSVVGTGHHFFGSTKDVDSFKFKQVKLPQQKPLFEAHNWASLDNGSRGSCDSLFVPENTK